VVNSLDDGAAPRTVVVTGASGGIGRAIAVAFAGLGWPVALGARRSAELEQTAELVAAAGGKPFAQTLDVRDVESINRFLSATSEQFGGVDVLVNNAGVAVPGAVHEMADDDHRAILETNLLGPMLLTKRVVQDLRRAGRPGDVVFISSDATVHVRPHMATYLSSKAGLEAFATTLALECEGTSIRSSIVRVGPTLTGFGDGWDPELFADLFPYWQRFGIQRHFNTMQPDDVARAVVSVATAPRHMWVPIVEVQPQPPVT
jgi:NAD(P)-dependent dehydrogenase (short-subunit alcohol dehydrogenase family)